MHSRFEMKIGIITFWQTQDNYGQVLQCWALQQRLAAMGHEPFLIRYDLLNPQRRIPWRTRIKRWLVRLLNGLYGAGEAVVCDVPSERGFDEFRKAHLTVSEKVYRTLKELRQSPPPAACYMAGSDQIWGFMLNNPENRVFFLDFGTKTTPRIAYAASFGRSEYPVRLKKRLRSALRKFDRVSVREAEGVRICASVGEQAVQVLDPTLLLHAASYRGLTEPPVYTDKYVFVYSINVHDAEEIRWSELQAYAASTQSRCVVTTASGYCAGRELYGDATYSYATVGQWLSHIAHAELVATTSFHGVVFSILYHRPFVYVPLAGRYAAGNNRVADLLSALGLEQRILRPTVSYASVAAQLPDWDDVERRLDALRSRSFDFLNQALSTHDKTPNYANTLH